MLEFVEQFVKFVIYFTILQLTENFAKMKIISILLLTAIVAIAMQKVRSEYLLVEVDDTEKRGKLLVY